MNSQKTVVEDFGTTLCSSRAFRVGDCVILNHVEQPCSKLICVVVKDDGEFYHCKYLNADKMLDSYNKPPMKNRLPRATKVEDFGVEIKAHDGKYWCEKVGESKATYADGKPRQWQEWNGPIKYVPRKELAEMLWPF